MIENVWIRTTELRELFPEGSKVKVLPKAFVGEPTSLDDDVELIGSVEGYDGFLELICVIIGDSDFEFWFYEDEIELVEEEEE